MTTAEEKKTASERDFAAFMARQEVALLIEMATRERPPPADLLPTLLRLAFRAGGESMADMIVEQMLGSALRRATAARPKEPQAAPPQTPT
jgi:hypothetical protein